MLASFSLAVFEDDMNIHIAQELCEGGSLAQVSETFSMRRGDDQMVSVYCH
jgi:hypothetical protein